MRLSPYQAPHWRFKRICSIKSASWQPTLSINIFVLDSFCKPEKTNNLMLCIHLMKVRCIFCTHPNPLLPFWTTNLSSQLTELPKSSTMTEDRYWHQTGSQSESGYIAESGYCPRLKSSLSSEASSSLGKIGKEPGWGCGGSKVELPYSSSSSLGGLICILCKSLAN